MNSKNNDIKLHPTMLVRVNLNKKKKINGLYNQSIGVANKKVKTNCKY